MQDERQPFVRRQGIEHDQQGKADRVGEQRLFLRLRSRPRPYRVGQVRPGGVLRAGGCACGSMFRHTRATMVVSHPPRFSTSAVPDRLSRSQVS